MSKLYCGIDPGKYGAVAFLGSKDPHIVFKVVRAKTELEEEFIDVEWLRSTLEYYNPDIVIIERQHPRPFDGKKSIFSLGRGYGRIEAIVDLLNLKAVYVLPQEWKKTVLPEGDHSKEAAIKHINTKYPNTSISYKGEQDHDMAEALCIAQYGKIKKL